MKFVKWLTIIASCLTVAAGLLLFLTIWYVKTDQAHEFLKSRINQQIPGSVNYHLAAIEFTQGMIWLTSIEIRNPQKQPIAGLDGIRLEISLPDLFKGHITIRSLIIDRPWATLGVDGEGRLNVVGAFAAASPDRKPKKESSDKEPFTEIPVFQLKIQQLQINQGKLTYVSQNQEQAIDAQLENIQIDAKADLFRQFIQIGLKTGPGKINAPYSVELKHLKAEAALTKDTLDPVDITLSTNLNDFSLKGRVDTLFSAPRPDIRIDARVRLEEVSKCFNLPDPFNGEVRSQIRLSGLLDNPYFSISSNYSGGLLAGQAVGSISLDCILRNKHLNIDKVAVNYASGHIALAGTVDLQEAFRKGFLSPPTDLNRIAYHGRLRVEGVRLESVLRHPNDLQGALDAELTFGGQGLDPKQTAAEYTLFATVSKLNHPRVSQPSDFTAHSKGVVRNGLLKIDPLTITSDLFHLSVAASCNLISQELAAQLSVKAPDLNALLTYGQLFEAQGKITLQGTVSGSLKNPRAKLVMQADQLAYDRFKLGDARLNVTLANGRITLTPFHIANKASSVIVQGHVQLLDTKRFVVLTDPTVDITVKSDSLLIEDFITDMQGRLSFSSHLEGSLKDPLAELTLEGRDLDLKKQGINRLQISGRLAGHQVVVDPIVVNFTNHEKIAGRLQLNLAPSFAVNTFAVDLATEGLSLNSIDALKKFSDVSATIKCRLSGNGSPAAPSLRAHLELQHIKVKETPLEDINLDVRLDNRILHLQGRQAFIVKADLILATNEFTGTVDLNHLDLGPVFQIIRREELEGTVDGGLHLKGNLKKLENAQADVTLKELIVRHNKKRLIEIRAFEATYAKGKIEIPKTFIILANEGRLTLQGRTALNDNLAIDIQGDLPLSIIQQFVPDLPVISGDSRITAAISGAIKKPRFKARVNLNNVGLIVPETNQKLHDVNAAISISSDAVKIETLSGMLDNGRFDLSARLDLKDLEPQAIDVTLNTLNLPIVVPDMLEMTVNSAIVVRGNPDHTRTKGEIIILGGRYYKDVDLSLAQMVTTDKRKVPPPPKPLDAPYIKHMELDLAIKQRNNFIVDNNLADMELRSDLTVGGTLQNPAVKGRAAIVSGVITYKKKEFEIKKGYIDFINPYKIEPEINLESTVVIRQWRITLILKGTPEALTLTFQSVPHEKEEDVLSILLFGKTTGELISGEGGSKESTSQMIASLIASTFGDDIKEQTGIDILEVDTQDKNNSSDNNQIKVTVGKKLTERLTLKYALTSREGETIQAAISEYQLLEHFLMRTSQDTAGNTGASLIYRIGFR